MRRLHPDPDEITAEQAISDLGLIAQALPDRPYVISNFAVTLDGRAAIDGRSGPIGSHTDSRLLHLLRTQVDAVLIGGGTMRAERYGPMIPDSELRAIRQRLGLRPDPLAAIVTDSLDLPWDAGLFTSGEGSVLLITSASATPPACSTPVELARHTGAVDLAATLEDLRRAHGVRALLTEGGPRLHAQLLAAGLVDELFVTIAPKITGTQGETADAPRIVEGLLPTPTDLDLVWLLEQAGELFARYRVRREPSDRVSHGRGKDKV